MDYTTRMLSSPPKDPNSAVLIDADRPGRTVSWLEYTSAVRRIAVGLRALGVTDAEGVGLISSNEIYYYVLGDGAVAAGGVFCPIPLDGDEKRLSQFVQAANATWLFTGIEFIEKSLLAAEILGMDKSRVIVFDPPGLEPYNGPQPKFSSLLNSDESLFQNPYEGKDPNKLIATRLFGSGTSGMVKAAELSHAAQLARLDTHLFVEDPRDTSWLHHIPLSYAPGNNLCMRACAGKLPFALTTFKGPEILIDKIEAGRCSQVQLTPAVMEGVTEAIESGRKSKDALASLETVLIGGTFARKDSVSRFKALIPEDTRLRTGYGCTEAGIVSMTPIDGPWEQGFTGFLEPRVELRIIDIETGKTLSPHTPGEICVRSPEVFSGYCNSPAANEASFFEDADGVVWHRTGDRGYLDAKNGQLVLHGRYNELFKVSGETVLPIDIDDVLMSHPSIERAAVTSVPARGKASDLEVIAYVVPRKGFEITPQQIVDYIADKMPEHNVPTGGVIFTPAIPRSPAGKVPRHQLINCSVLPGSERYLAVSAAA